MKKLIILLTLVTGSFSAEKWEYCIGVATEIRVSGELKKTKFKVLKSNINNKPIQLYGEDVVKSDEKIDHQWFDNRPSLKENINKLVGINKLGNEGWELMFKESFDKGYGQTDYHYYFKRKQGS